MPFLLLLLVSALFVLVTRAMVRVPMTYPVSPALVGISAAPIRPVTRIFFLNEKPNRDPRIRPTDPDRPH